MSSAPEARRSLKGPPMESFPVDIDAEQIVRWIIAERAATPSTFKTTARRTIEVREIPERRELHLGDEEREELSEVATIATLEVAPTHATDGWLLTVTVEDEIGPRVSGEEAATETEQQIDLGTFYNTFIRPGRGTANVVAAVDSSSARRSLHPPAQHNRAKPACRRASPVDDLRVPEPQHMFGPLRAHSYDS